MTRGASTPARGPWWSWAGLVALLTLAVALRVVPMWQPLRPDGAAPRPVDNDALFHFRHAVHVAENFPDLQRWEDVARYPELERNDASGLWDLALGAAGHAGAAVTGATPADATAWAAFFAPPLVLALAILLGWALLRRVTGPGLSLLGAGLMVALPGDTFLRTAAGCCDHHVVEMLCGVWLILAWVGLLAKDDAGTPWWRPAWAGASPLTVLHFSWLGGPLHLALWCVIAGAQTLLSTAAEEDPRHVARKATRLLLAHGAMAGAWGLLWPETVLRPGLHRWMLCGVGAAALAFGVLGWGLALAGRRRPGRGKYIAGGAAAGALALAAAAWLLSPPLRAAWRFGFGVKAETVLEHLPVGVKLFFTLSGPAGALLLLAPLLLLVTGVWRKPAAVAVVLAALLHAALWARTGDYIYQVALWAVLGATAGIAALAAESPKTTRVVAAAAALATLAGIGRWTYPLTAGAPARMESEGMRVNHEGWKETADWWRTVPAPPPPPDAPARPGSPFPPRGAAGVLGDWASGNVVNTYTAWPAINSRYPDAEGLRPLFATTEMEALVLPLRGATVETSTRWVVVEPRTFGDYFFAHLDTLGLPRESFVGTAHIDTPNGPREIAAAGPRRDTLLGRRLLLTDGSGLGRFRLVFESSRGVALRHLHDPATQQWHLQSDRVPPEGRAGAEAALARRSWPEGRQIGYRGELHSSVKVFELVPGALLRGRAAPGAKIRATLDARARHSGRDLNLEWTIRAEDDGTWNLRVPYATAELPGWIDVVPDSAGFLVHAEGGATRAGFDGEGSARVRVADDAVRNGAVVWVEAGR